MSGKTERLSLQIIGASCTSCARVIRRELEKRNGVTEVKTNTILNAVYIDFEPQQVSEVEIQERVRKLGYRTVRLHGMA